MDLSVVIITRNEAPRLRFCLASIEAACARAKRDLGAEIEVIVVDDTSTDETAELCASFRSEISIRYERNVQCEGRSASSFLMETRS
jgi:glycosyltransferase involved in cell wall biosynthesis